MTRKGLALHADEHIDSRVIKGLQKRGIDVTSSKEANLLQQSDESQFEYTRRVGRVLVTHDDDFTRFDLDGHPGVCYSHQYTLRIGELIEFLYWFSLTTMPQDIAGRVEFMKPL